MRPRKKPTSTTVGEVKPDKVVEKPVDDVGVEKPGITGTPGITTRSVGGDGESRTERDRDPGATTTTGDGSARNRADSDGDGQISLSEIRAAQDAWYRGDITTETMREYFGQYFDQRAPSTTTPTPTPTPSPAPFVVDADADGRISRTEVQRSEEALERGDIDKSAHVGAINNYLFPGDEAGPASRSPAAPSRADVEGAVAALRRGEIDSDRVRALIADHNAAAAPEDAVGIKYRSGFVKTGRTTYRSTWLPSLIEGHELRKDQRDQARRVRERSERQLARSRQISRQNATAHNKALADIRSGKITHNEFQAARDAALRGEEYISEKARVEAERAAAAEKTRVEAERAAAAEKTRVEAERAAAAEKTRVETEREATSAPRRQPPPAGNRRRDADRLRRRGEDRSAFGRRRD